VTVKQENDCEYDSFRDQPEGSADLAVEIENHGERPDVQGLRSAFERGVDGKKGIRVGKHRQSG